MNEPMTMWDWGMYRLQSKLEGTPTDRSAIGLPDTISFFYSVDYDWDKNRITLYGRFGIIPSTFNDGSLTWKSYPRAPPGPSIEESKAICKNAAKWIRTSFSVDFRTGKLREDAEVNRIYTAFSHMGFSSTTQPGDLATELEDMTEIRLVVPMRVEARGPLLSNQLYYREIDDLFGD
jgi:hypothetical protein